MDAAVLSVISIGGAVSVCGLCAVVTRAAQHLAAL